MLHVFHNFLAVKARLFSIFGAKILHFFDIHKLKCEKENNFSFFAIIAISKKSSNFAVAFESEWLGGLVLPSW